MCAHDAHSGVSGASPPHEVPFYRLLLFPLPTASINKPLRHIVLCVRACSVYMPFMLSRLTPLMLVATFILSVASSATPRHFGMKVIEHESGCMLVDSVSLSSKAAACHIHKRDLVCFVNGNATQTLDAAAVSNLTEMTPCDRIGSRRHSCVNLVRRGTKDLKRPQELGSSQAGLGLKLRRLPFGYFGIVEVEPGSVAHSSGKLHPGDWMCTINGRNASSETEEGIQKGMMAPLHDSVTAQICVWSLSSATHSPPQTPMLDVQAALSTFQETLPFWTLLIVAVITLHFWNQKVPQTAGPTPGLAGAVAAVAAPRAGIVPLSEVALYACTKEMIADAVCPCEPPGVSPNNDLKNFQGCDSVGIDGAKVLNYSQTELDQLLLQVECFQDGKNALRRQDLLESLVALKPELIVVGIPTLRDDDNNDNDGDDEQLPTPAPALSPAPATDQVHFH